MVAAASSSVPKRPIGQWTSRSSKVAAELDHGGFSRRVPHLGRGCADVGEEGRCIDHCTAGRLGALQVFDAVLATQEHRGQVGFLNAMPRVEVGAQRGPVAAVHQSDVVVDNVEPAESIDDSLIHRLDLRLVHEVSR